MHPVSLLCWGSNFPPGCTPVCKLSAWLHPINNSFELFALTLPMLEGIYYPYTKVTVTGHKCILSHFPAGDQSVHQGAPRWENCLLDCTPSLICLKIHWGQNGKCTGVSRIGRNVVGVHSGCALHPCSQCTLVHPSVPQCTLVRSVRYGV